MTNDYTIEVGDLKKRYRDTAAVDGVSFRVKRGEILGILGPNGSGKTTIIKSILGLLRYDAGEVYVKGISNKKDPGRALSHMGAVLEGNRNVYFYLTAEENVNYFAGIRGLTPRMIKERRETLLRELGLYEVRRRQMRTYSRGMQQKLAIAAALIHDPEILLLDDPTLGLDVETTRHMRDWVKQVSKQQEKTILVTSHDMNFIESVCDRILIIRKGKIISSETVQSLRKLFAGKLYSIRVNGTIAKDREKQLEKQLEKLGPLVISREQGDLLIKLALTDDMKAFDLMEILKTANTNILDLTVKEKDFEEIFLYMVNDDHKEAS